MSSAIVAEQRELLRLFREKENSWERMRKLLEKQVTKLSESIASSRRNSLTPWGMSLLSWLNLDSDHASAQDDEYEDHSRNGSDDEYVLSDNVNDDDDGRHNADGASGDDDTVVVVLPSGDSFPVERGGDAGSEDWSRTQSMPGLRSRSRLRSREEGQSVSETRGPSAVLSRDRSRSRSPAWSTGQTPGSESERRRFSRSRHSRPLSRHLSRSRPDLTSILEPDAHDDNSSDDRTLTPDSDRSSTSEYTPGSNWSFDQELPPEELHDSNQSSSYYVDESDGYDEGDYDDDTPDEYASPRDSASPVGIDTEEDTRTVVSVSDSAEFSLQEESDEESRSLADSMPVTVDSGTTFGDLNEETYLSAYDDDDVAGWSSSDRSANYGDDDDKNDHPEQDLQTYSPSVTYPSEIPVHDDYVDTSSHLTDVYHDREQHTGEAYSDPSPGHLTDSAGNQRETPEDGRPDFSNVILDIDITVSAEETVEESHALPESRNRTPSSPVEEMAARRKRRRRGDDGDAEGSDSKRKRRRRDNEGNADGIDCTRARSRRGDDGDVESFDTTRRKGGRGDGGIDSSRTRSGDGGDVGARWRNRRDDDGGVKGAIPARRKSRRGDGGDIEPMNSTRTIQRHGDEGGVEGERVTRMRRRHGDVEDMNSTKTRRRYDDEHGIGNMSSRKRQPKRPDADTRSPQDARTTTYPRDYVTGNTGSAVSRGFNPPQGDPSTWMLGTIDPLVQADDSPTLPRSLRLRKHPTRRHSSSSVGRTSTSEARGRNTSHSSSAQECASGDGPRNTSSRTSRKTGRTSTIAAGREDVPGASDSAAVTGSGYRRHTIQGIDSSTTVRSRHRPSRNHKDQPAGSRSPVDGQEAESIDDVSWFPDSDHSSDESLSTELTLDSTYEVRIPKSWVQMLNEYDSQDSDDSWQP